MEKTWIRYKNRFAWGTEKRWTYEEIPKLCIGEEEYIQDWIEEHIHSRNDWSDKYRVIEYDLITLEDVPMEKLKDSLESLESRLKRIEEEIIRFNNLIETKKNL